jgi:UDP-N-acetyl-D-glucosamine/UDP-N-acetyl-D-galactosamine dehydrogenase
LNRPSAVTVVGLGYVGLPLALAFATEFPTIGLDVDSARVEELQKGDDRNREVSEDQLRDSSASFSTDYSTVADAEFIVVTVPTPVTANNEPDLSLLESASAMIGARVRDRSPGKPVPIIVFESTTYPGCTEDFCGPVIERESSLKSGEGFFLGYSPERTNFGDTEHTLQTVIKVVSGQTPAVAEVVSSVYGQIAKAGIHLAADIKTAEASKVIENVQRDLNIALFNELAMIFDRMDINSSDVFDAAATKWNFHRYQPGLVGGHCIPVDPYYLTYVSRLNGYDPKVILSGRDTNESMVDLVVGKIESLSRSMASKSELTSVLVLGQTFKKDVSDVRNSKAIQLSSRLEEIYPDVASYDPLNDPEGNSDPFTGEAQFDIVIIAVPHTKFLQSSSSIVSLVNPHGILVDLGGDIEQVEMVPSTITYWKL